MQIFIVAVATETDVHSEEFFNQAEARERFDSLKESRFMVSFSTVSVPPAVELQHALKLAFIKLVQVGGFNSVDGVKTPDPQAHKQILDAIHTFDPAFTEGDWAKPTPETALAEALHDMLEAYAPNAERTACTNGEAALHSAVRKAREALGIAAPMAPETKAEALDRLNREMERIDLDPFSVGRTDCTGDIRRFATLAEAEAHIAEIEKTDPEGVHRGDYYVDGPEELINPPTP